MIIIKLVQIVLICFNDFDHFCGLQRYSQLTIPAQLFVTPSSFASGA